MPPSAQAAPSTKRGPPPEGRGASGRSGGSGQSQPRGTHLFFPVPGTRRWILKDFCLPNEMLDLTNYIF